MTLYAPPHDPVRAVNRLPDLTPHDPVTLYALYTVYRI
jgi:hypothetical protein